MTDVYLPLPYTPIVTSQEPRVLFPLGRIYDDLELENRVTENFFSLHSRHDYRRLSQEQYYFLYPEERLLLPGRIIDEY